ncbi:hypothetical protein J6590_060492 [Homalodisca vitripennis]|nr:hypothetical protein J6590_060492 [Homalodisca vitripennis]
MSIQEAVCKVLRRHIGNGSGSVACYGNTATNVIGLFSRGAQMKRRRETVFPQCSRVDDLFIINNLDNTGQTMTVNRTSLGVMSAQATQI